MWKSTNLVDWSKSQLRTYVTQFPLSIPPLSVHLAHQAPASKPTQPAWHGPLQQCGTIQSRCFTSSGRRDTTPNPTASTRTKRRSTASATAQHRTLSPSARLVTTLRRGTRGSSIRNSSTWINPGTTRAFSKTKPTTRSFRK